MKSHIVRPALVFAAGCLGLAAMPLRVTAAQATSAVRVEKLHCADHRPFAVHLANASRVHVENVTLDKPAATACMSTAPRVTASSVAGRA